MIKWRILIDGKRSPQENMAIDEAIMLGLEEGFSEPTIRFYDWDPPTASFGYHQDVEKETDIERISVKGYGLIRRPTGGRLVLHKNEVTYAVVAPLTDHLQGNVLEVYSEISKALAEGFRQMGIEVDFEKGSLTASEQREVHNPCFSSSSRYELSFEGKKIVGSAQVRRNSLFLQHGSILLDQNQAEVAELLPGLNPEQRSKLYHYLGKKTISINEILDRPLCFHEAVSYLIAGFKKIWQKDVFFTADALSLYEQEKVNELVREKYATKQWTYVHGKKGCK